MTGTTLREHAVLLQLFSADGKVMKTAQVTISSARETALNELRNLPMPQWILINSESHGYCTTIFDESSLKYILSNYRMIQNALTPITRYGIWKALLDCVLQCRLKIWDFIDFAADLILMEQN